MNKVLIVLLVGVLVAVSAVNPGLNSGASGVQNRLIQFNDTYMKWMTQEEVHELAVNSECGAGRGFMDITDFPNLGRYTVPVVNDIPVNPTHQAQVRELIPFLSAKAISDSITHLSSYPTRYYRDITGRDAAEWIHGQFRAYSTHRNDVEVTYFPNSFVQPSVIARISGSAKPDEVVIIGAHIDSISNGATAPGADDDASGTSTVLEIFRVLSTSNFKPVRTVEFHGYAGEEAGLLGSQAIANNYAQRGVKVVSMLQLDMTGYVRPGTNPTIGIVTDFTNAQLTAFTRALTDTYLTQKTTRWANTACGYGCSDHASWTRAGYPAAFPFEGLFSNSNPNIHTVRDLISHLNLGHALSFAEIGLSYVVELSLD